MTCDYSPEYDFHHLIQKSLAIDIQNKVRHFFTKVKISKVTQNANEGLPKYTFHPRLQVHVLCPQKATESGTECVRQICVPTQCNTL